MSAMTGVRNLRCDRKISQEKTNAIQGLETRTIAGRSMLSTVSVSLAFVFLLVAVTAPASAATFDLSNITELLDSFIGILPKFLDLLIGYAPLAVGGAIIGAIVAFPKKILEMFDKMF